LRKNNIRTLVIRQFRAINQTFYFIPGFEGNGYFSYAFYQKKTALFSFSGFFLYLNELFYPGILNTTDMLFHYNNPLALNSIYLLITSIVRFSGRVNTE